MHAVASLIILAITPWVAGGLGLLSTYNSVLSPDTNRCILFGIGGVLGLLGFGMLNIVATWLGWSFFHRPGLLVIIFAFLNLSLAVLTFAKTKNLIRVSPLGEPAQKARFVKVALLLPPVAIAIVALQLVWLTPTTGWDNFGGWATFSKLFIEANQVSDIRPWAHDGTHPSTAAVIAAWSAWSLEHAGSVGPVYFSWWLAWLSILFIVYGYTLAVTHNLVISLLAATMSATLPLLTNHTVMAGYAEIFLAATAAGATALLSLGQFMKNRRAIALGILVALTAAFYKNTGPIFCTCVIAGWLLSTMIGCGHGKKVFIGLVTTAVGTFSLLTLLGSYSEAVIFLGNRELIIQVDNILLIPRNELYILFINSSFSIAPWFLLFPMIFLLQSRTLPLASHTTSAALTPWLVALAILMFLMSAQLTEYGFLFASPGQDTGNSRLTLPAIICATLSIGWLARFMTAPDTIPRLK